MSMKLTLEIRPKSEVSDALDKAYKLAQTDGTTGGSSKSGRTKYEYLIPGTNIKMEITRNEPSANAMKNRQKGTGPAAAKKAEQAARANYLCHARPAEYLVESQALSRGCSVKKLSEVQLAIFKAGLKSKFPTLPDSVLQAVEDSDCTLASLSVDYYFEQADDTDAYEMFLDIRRHAEVVLNSAMKPPTRAKGWKKLLPRVHSSDVCRHAFTISLPFGQVHVSLKRERDEYPALLASVKSTDDRQELISTIRCLVCIEVEVDIAKFNAVDSDDLEVFLSSNCQLWTKGKQKENPAKGILDSVRRELMLDTPLATDDDEVDGSALNDSLQEVLQAYQAGDDVRYHDVMISKPGLFPKYRKTLLSKANVDILIPWSVAKLNLSNKLGAALTFDNSLKFVGNQVLATHALTVKNIDEVIAKFDAQMTDVPGWFAIQSSDQPSVKSDD